MNDPASPPPETTPPRSRRAFLALTVGGAAVAGGAAYLLRDRGELDPLDAPEPMSEAGRAFAALVRQKLPTLDIPEATLAHWVNRYERYVDASEPHFGKPVLESIQGFLMSTDFFPACDESEPLRFVAYYDPYVSVCYNPLREG